MLFVLGFFKSISIETKCRKYNKLNLYLKNVFILFINNYLNTEKIKLAEEINPEYFL